jgi:hypothetical protein
VTPLWCIYNSQNYSFHDWFEDSNKALLTHKESKGVQHGWWSITDDLWIYGSFLPVKSRALGRETSSTFSINRKSFTISDGIFEKLSFARKDTLLAYCKKPKKRCEAHERSQLVATCRAL